MSHLVTFEGLDGTGKSTLVNSVLEQIRGKPEFPAWIYASKEPGSMWTGIGPEIRKLVLDTPDFKPFERELLFYVDASLHSRFMQNQQGALVLSDRGLWSHLAYVRGYLKTKQIDHDDYVLCKSLIKRTCAEPNAVVYLRGSVELMKARTAGKVADSIEQNDTPFFSAVLDTYEDLVVDANLLQKNVIVLDACDTCDTNTKKVVQWLYEQFKDRQGNSEVC